MTAPGRVWFYRPEFSLGWPFARGHDEHARFTVLISFPWTGRAVIAWRDCGRCEPDRDYIDAVKEAPCASA